MTRPAPARRPRRTAPAKPAYHHGDLRRALIAAALDLIEQGGEPVTLRGAAVAAGVSVAAPYRHFDSREALLAAVLAEGFRDLTLRTQRARDAASGPREALIATGAAYVRFAADRPRLYRLMFGPACDKAAFPDLMEAGRASLGVLRQAVFDGRGHLGVPDGEVDRVALTGWSLVHGLASLFVDGLMPAARTPAQIEALARGMVAALLDGVDGGTASAAATPVGSRAVKTGRAGR